VFQSGRCTTCELGKWNIEDLFPAYCPRDGKYEIIDEIGHGGMAMVYLVGNQQQGSRQLAL
jgi:hypothetical protein